MRAALSATIAFAFLAACGDDPSVIPIDRIVRFVPDHLDFGMAPTGDQSELPAKLESTGGNKLQIRDVRFDPQSDVFLPRRASNGALRGSYLSPADPIDLVITFEPILAGPAAANMYVVFEGGEAKLPLTGEAFVVAPAHAALEPSAVLFQPSIELGRRVTQTITVRNEGEKAGSVRVISAQPPFSVTEVGGGAISSEAIAPGESRALEVAFTPTAVGSYTKTIKIALEDSAPAELSATGEGVEAGMLTCTQPMLSFGDAERGQVRDLPLDCTASGGAYTFQSAVIDNPTFTIIAGLPAANSRITDLHLTIRFNASGNARNNVTGTLAITSATGEHDMITLVGNVIGPQPQGTDLKITMTWNAAGTDFDLHLVRNGRLPFENGEDCYWDAYTLDWGNAGNPDDDPFLDKDARNGMGPEEINLGRATGFYDAYVQYFGANAPAPTVPITFDYWLKGVHGTALMHTIAICGHTWKVGRIDFSGAMPQFTADGSEVDTWSGRAIQCP